MSLFRLHCGALSYFRRKSENMCILHSKDRHPTAAASVPICSDFPVFFPFALICALRFREFAPICSDFFRVVPAFFQNRSEKISTDQESPFLLTPFCKSPITRGNDSGWGIVSLCPHTHLLRTVALLHTSFRARKGIPKNLSSQVFGELRVNFLV